MTAPPSTSRKRLPSWFKTFVFPIILIVITAAVTYGLTEYSNRLRYLDVYINTYDGMLSRNIIHDESLKVSFGSKTLDNVSSMVVDVRNNSGRDFRDVPIQLTFTGHGGIEPKMLISLAEAYPEHVVLTPMENKSQGVVRLKYNIGFVGQRSQPIFVANFLFEGDKAPTVDVDVLKEGVDAKPTVFGPPSAWTYIALGAVLGGGFVAIIAGALISELRKRAANRTAGTTKAA